MLFYKVDTRKKQIRELLLGGHHLSTKLSYSAEEKRSVVETYLQGKTSKQDLAEHYGTGKSTTPSVPDIWLGGAVPAETDNEIQSGIETLSR